MRDVTTTEVGVDILKKSIRFEKKLYLCKNNQKWQKTFSQYYNLVMPIFAYEKLVSYDFVNAIIENVSIKFILFDEQEKTIIKWIE